ncbi:MAG: hypothetical protein MI674_00030 [Cytophagales bacterium]|nr:hypothetical protein [Cytophagales bacterium]
MAKHRGKIVEEAIRKSGYAISKTAAMLGITRNTLYNKFKLPDLSYRFIAEVGSVIDYDFTVDLPELEREVDIDAFREKALCYFERNASDFLFLEKKYTKLLERYNDLLVLLVKVANDHKTHSLKEQIAEFMENVL